MTNAEHRTDDEHDAPKGNTPGINPSEEDAMDKALRAEDEADDAAATAEVLGDGATTTGTSKDAE